MLWQEVRERFPNQWLIVEATEARSEMGKRLIDQMSVVNGYTDGTVAWKAYAEFHRRDPDREYLVLHTDREAIDVRESFRLPIRLARCV